MRYIANILMGAALFFFSATVQTEAQHSCTAFETQVSCDQNTGRWDVVLSNTAQSPFAPDELQISTPDSALTLHQDDNTPLLVSIEGANPGDTITLTVNAIEDGAGGAPGLDLCCMGDIQVTIPKGETCEAPPPDRTLEVSKVCEPLGYEDSFGSNVECTFTINYSGPPPTVQNPISVTDTLASGGPMVINSHWPPSGINAWDCTPEPSSGPYTCNMHTGIDTTVMPGYWTAYTTSFTVQAAMPEPYRNCAKAHIETAGGASVTDEDCAQAGEFDLVVEKVLAEEHGGVCLPGQSCTFEITVTNNGPDPYVGDITLSDEVVLTGASNSGTLTGITPPVCTIAELTSTGCTTGVSLNAGQSTSYSVDYTVPANLEDGVSGGKNCVALTDATLQPMQDPEDVDGHFACAPFSVEEPKIRVEKQFVADNFECSAGSACDFTITIFNDGDAPFSGPVAIRDTDTPGGMIIMSVTPPVCLPLPTATPFDCSANVTVPAGGSQVITFTAFMPLLPIDPNADGSLKNCVDGEPAAGAPDGWPADLFDVEKRSCSEVFFCAYACHTSPEVTDKLTITKSLLNAEDCLPGAICTYKIEVANLSSGAITGPIMLEEHLPTNATVTQVRSLPWSCGPASGNVVPCVYPPLPLAAGAVTSFEIDVAIPANFEEAQIANCAGFPGDSSPLSAARSAAKATVAGPASLFSRSQGYGAQELSSYLQIRGVPAELAQLKATRMNEVRQSGARTKGAKEMSCAVKTLREEASLDVNKTCELIEAIAGAPAQIDCTIRMQVNGASEGDQINLTDQMTGFGDGTSFGSSPWFDGDLSNYPCIADDPNAQTTCVIPVTAGMANGDPWEVSGTILMEPWEEGAVLENCADASLRSDASVTDRACASITLPSFITPKMEDTVEPVLPPLDGGAKLTLSKTSAGECTVNKTAQRYECDFDIEASNVGTAPFKGPLVLTDVFKTEPKPQKFTLNGDSGWSCLRATQDAASCVYSGDSIAAGASASMGISIILPGLHDGGEFTNCISATVPEDDFLRIQMVQQILLDDGFDVGTVDGSFGPRTGRAVKALQKKLGVKQSGKIDEALFTALGLGSDDVREACATVELPPMPEIICPTGQRKNTRGVCYLPEKKCNSGQVKNSAGKCYTPDRSCKKGQVKNSSGKCYTPEQSCKRGQLKNSKGQCYWAECPSGQKRNSRGKCYVVDVGPKCDVRSTVARGNECACRYKNMRKATSTRCACRNGLPPVRGVGCVNVTINRGGGGGDAVDSPERRNCVTIAGITKCF